MPSAEAWEQGMVMLAAALDEEVGDLPSTTVQIGSRELRVLEARTIEQKAKGMAGRRFGDHDGMLFVEPVETRATWTGRGLVEPVVLALFDEEGQLVEEPVLLTADVVEHRALRPFRYALELPGDLELALDIGPLKLGDEISG